MQYLSEEQTKEMKAFCPSCGELDIKDGKVIHPEEDIILRDMLLNGFKVSKA